MKTPLQRRFLTVLCLLFSTFCVTAAEISPTGNILYVKKGATGNGSSWENALGELSKALQWAQANKSANLWDTNNPLRIYVAKGTYTPSINPVDNTPVSAGNKRNATFLLVKDVQLYGGFAGTEIALTDRNLSLSANASILSGDFNGDDAGFTNNGENANHVVISAGAVGTAELNGFTLTGGNANSSGNITVNSQSIYQNSGGGIYNAGSSPVLTNVTISANTATNNGGGICNVASSPVLTNVTISTNTGISGGGIYNFETSSKPQIRNSIIYGNSSGIVGGASVVSYSLAPGLTGTNNGNIGGNTNPQFVDAANGDFSLKNISPLINKGNNTYFDAGQTPDLSAITTDIAGNARIQKGKIDLGAYESSYSTPLSPDDNNVIYVTETGNGDFTGNSWANATNDLQMAINVTGVQQVWVAGGTYKPKYRADDMSDANANDRDNAFVLKKDVQVYGGFAGTETALTDRNLTLSTNASILSGDLGTANVKTDNAYHVVISAGAVGTAELNGFTITNGNANGSLYIKVNTKAILRSSGGGIYNESSSPVLTNVIISANTTTTSGGGISNYVSYPVLTNVSINGNTATTVGGGIYNESSSPVLTNATISTNTADVNGGGIFNSDSSSPVLTNVSISANTTDGNGGGIYNRSSSPVLTNVSISKNTAVNGGAMYNNYTESKPQIRNSIIYDNNTGIYNSNGAAPVISYSLVQGLNSTANGNIAGSTDPQFVDAANGDYSLKNTSPVINKGNNTYFATGQTPDLSAITTDLAGNPRIQKGKIDLGAYESSYSTLLSPDDNNVIYVTETGNGDFTGNSWANATDDLQMAINATGVQQVWVAGGTYKPMYRADNMSDANANDRNNAFVLKKDVQVYGGFAGTETKLTDRDLSLSTHTSILSGDLGTATDNTDNAYHVVISAGAMGTAELNGFTLTGGNANGFGGSITVNSRNINQFGGGGIFNSGEDSSPVLSNLSISQNTALYGGGIFNSEDSSPVLTNVSISANTATFNGGGICNSEGSSPILTHVSISSNTANGAGGGIANNNSSPVLTNVSISSNTAAYYGGGMYNEGAFSKPQIRNSIIYGNDTGIDGAGIAVISYSLVQDLSDTANGNIDGSTDPQFVDAANGDFSLKANSPAINKGSDTYFTTGQTPDLSAITTDIAGNARIQKGKIDLGAYESSYSTPLSPDDNNVIYVTETGNGDFTGNSWANATDDLQMAIDATNVQQVWVAGGTYKPMYRADNMSGANANDRNNAFVLKKDVQVYGGFAGTETKLTDRDLSLSTHTSILSGDLGTATDNTDNAYHVVISAGDVGTAELNGFTLTGGNANYSGESITVNSQYIYRNIGGGIFNSDSSSPVLSNLTISQNTADYYGGGIYNGSLSSPVLTNLTISQNTATYGGGIYNSKSSSLVLTNVSISSNRAIDLGGGIYNGRLSSPVLTNVTISANIADGDGGGIYNDGTDSNPQIRNSIIYDNNTGIYNSNGAAPVISYSLVQDLSDTANGNIDGSTDPQFVDAAHGDYSLKSTSPLINKGNDTYFDAGQTPDLSAITTDLAGNARLIGTNIDMGAYEYQDGTVPVTLVNYTAKANGNQVKLQWQTAEERNNKGFVIYRSGDNTLFTPIGEVPATLNALLSTFNFTDTNPLNGNNYYKLVQVDKDGTATELGIRTVGFSLSAFSLQLFPNPTTELVHSSFSSNSYNLLTIADLNGRVLQQLQIQTDESSITVSLADYPTGTYLLRFSGKDGAVIKKVVKR